MNLEFCNMLKFNRMAVVEIVCVCKQFICEDFKDPKKSTKKDEPEFIYQNKL